MVDPRPDEPANPNQNPRGADPSGAPLRAAASRGADPMPSAALPPRPGTGPGRRAQWAGLLLAALIVAASAVLTRRGPEDGAGPGFGPVAQAVPADPALAVLPTGPEVGRLAPDFLLQGLDGRPVRLSDLRGRPVLLHFGSFS